MTPVGYMLKRIVKRPAWLEPATVEDVYSVSGCVSRDFTDFIPHWKHNGYWLFDAPAVMTTLAKAEAIDLAGTRLFYYEAYEVEWNDEWLSFEPERSFTTNVQAPETKTLEGFDVVAFSLHTSPECSPLSCNNLAASIPVNRHCLMSSLEGAKAAIERGLFDNSEPGPYRILGVYSLE